MSIKMATKVEIELNPTQNKIFEAIAASDNGELKVLLTQLKGGIDFSDENGMSPLQHAAYKGNKEAVQLLLDQGADVNHCQHMCNYTALHFAALSGNSEVCQALLLSGANSGSVNSVGRTASQMAAFVNNHNCVAIINNFISKSDIEYYTQPQGLQTEPTLPPILAESFHKFAMSVNLHPVYLVQSLQKYVGLLDHLSAVTKTLQLMSEREIKKAKDCNEVMAFKFHYLSCIASEVEKTILRQSKDVERKVGDIVEVMAKKLLKTNKDGTPEFQENFIRECIREFPNRECTTFRQVVMTLAGQDPPPAVVVISSAINGQRAFNDSISTCFTCGLEKPAKKCSKCRAVQYCDRECQRLHWFMHKKTCARLAQMPQQGAMNTVQKSCADTTEITEHIKNLISQSNTT